jgi:large subunit ribosomal protein L31
MRTGIHPTREPAVVTCVTCGTEIETRWAVGDLTVETCSQCHPVYTGKAAKVTGGSRIERFERRFAREAPANRGNTDVTSRVEATIRYVAINGRGTTS